MNHVITAAHLGAEALKPVFDIVGGAATPDLASAMLIKAQDVGRQFARRLAAGEVLNPANEVDPLRKAVLVVMSNAVVTARGEQAAPVESNELDELVKSLTAKAGERLAKGADKKDDGYKGRAAAQGLSVKTTATAGIRAARNRRPTGTLNAHGNRESVMRPSPYPGRPGRKDNEDAISNMHVKQGKEGDAGHSGGRKTGQLKQQGKMEKAFNANWAKLGIGRANGMKAMMAGAHAAKKERRAEHSMDGVIGEFDRLKSHAAEKSKLWMPGKRRKLQEEYGIREDAARQRHKAEGPGRERVAAYRGARRAREDFQDRRVGVAALGVVGGGAMTATNNALPAAYRRSEEKRAKRDAPAAPAPAVAGGNVAGGAAAADHLSEAQIEQRRDAAKSGAAKRRKGAPMQKSWGDLGIGRKAGMRAMMSAAHAGKKQHQGDTAKLAASYGRTAYDDGMSRANKLKGKQKTQAVIRAHHEEHDAREAVMRGGKKDDGLAGVRAAAGARDSFNQRRAGFATAGVAMTLANNELPSRYKAYEEKRAIRHAPAPAVAGGAVASGAGAANELSEAEHAQRVAAAKSGAEKRRKGAPMQKGWLSDQQGGGRAAGERHKVKRAQRQVADTDTFMENLRDHRRLGTFLNHAESDDGGRFYSIKNAEKQRAHDREYDAGEKVFAGQKAAGLVHAERFGRRDAQADIDGARRHNQTALGMGLGPMGTIARGAAHLFGSRGGDDGEISEAEHQQRVDAARASAEKRRKGGGKMQKSAGWRSMLSAGRKAKAAALEHGEQHAQRLSQKVFETKRGLGADEGAARTAADAALGQLRGAIPKRAKQAGKEGAWNARMAMGPKLVKGMAGVVARAGMNALGRTGMASMHANVGGGRTARRLKTAGVIGVAGTALAVGPKKKVDENGKPLFKGWGAVLGLGRKAGMSEMRQGAKKAKANFKTEGYGRADAVGEVKRGQAMAGREGGETRGFVDPSSKGAANSRRAEGIGNDARDTMRGQIDRDAPAYARQGAQGARQAFNAKAATNVRRAKVAAAVAGGAAAAGGAAYAMTPRRKQRTEPGA